MHQQYQADRRVIYPLHDVYRITTGSFSNDAQLYGFVHIIALTSLFKIMHSPNRVGKLSYLRISDGACVYRRWCIHKDKNYHRWHHNLQYRVITATKLDPISMTMWQKFCMTIAIEGWLPSYSLKTYLIKVKHYYVSFILVDCTINLRYSSTFECNSSSSIHLFSKNAIIIICRRTLRCAPVTCSIIRLGWW